MYFFFVSVLICSSQNYIICEISGRDLLHPSKEELLENLKYQTVTDVHWIIKGRGKKVFLTKYMILSFNSHSFHAKIKVAYMRCPVHPYMPNILRCFKCQCYGNSKISFGVSVTCVHCTKVGDGSKFLQTLKVVLTVRVITLHLRYML